MRRNDLRMYVHYMMHNRKAKIIGEILSITKRNSKPFHPNRYWTKRYRYLLEGNIEELLDKCCTI